MRVARPLATFAPSAREHANARPPLARPRAKRARRAPAHAYARACAAHAPHACARARPLWAPKFMIIMGYCRYAENTLLH